MKRVSNRTHNFPQIGKTAGIELKQLIWDQKIKKSYQRLPSYQRRNIKPFVIISFYNKPGFCSVKLSVVQVLSGSSL